MSVLAAFVAHEARAQLRSLRFRVLSAVYLLLCAAPAVFLLALERTSEQTLGPATFAAFLFQVQPALTALLAAVLSADGIVREREEGSFPVVSLTPLTSASYLGGRWLALVTLLTALSLAPPALTAATAHASGAELHDGWAFVLPWALRVAPVVVAVSALALGLGTLAGGTIPGAILGAVLILGAQGLAANALARWHRGLEGAGELVALDTRRLQMAVWVARGWRELEPASEAAPDPRASLELAAPRAALLVGLGALALGASCLYLRRTRPDVAPLRIPPEHALATFARALLTVRQAARPDPHPAPVDLRVAAAGLAAFVACAGYLSARGESLRRLAVARHQAETADGPEPTPLGVVPVSWAFRGSLDGDGRLTGSAVLELRNTSARPASHLAFTLNPFVPATESPRSAASWRRAWDRLSARLAEPLLPGATLRLELLLTGRPATVWHGFAAGAEERFSPAFEDLHRNQLALGKYDFSRSLVRRSASRRRVLLAGDDLAPLPRYRPWSTPAAEADPRQGRAVPSELTLELADVSVELDGPSGYVLADSCGSVSARTSSGIRLSSSCRLPLRSYRVAGGALSLLPRPPAGFSAFAALPGHVDAATRHLPSFERAAALAGEAWPGLSTLEGAAVVELPAEIDPDPPLWDDSSRELLHPLDSGRLVLVREDALTYRKALPPEPLAAQTVATGLLSLRAVDRRERAFFAGFYRLLVRSRLPSSGPRPTAVLGAHNNVTMPLLKSGGDSGPTWAYRAPAILKDLEARAGTRAMDDGLAEFLQSGGDAGTCRELLRTIGRHAGLTLDGSYYEDYFEGAALPALTLVSARLTREGAQYRVSGTLRNEGTGQALCPLVLRTDTEPATQVVSVGSGAEASFSFLTPAKPRLVQLDPDGRCFRHAKVGLTTSLEPAEGG